jgi:glycosyltransferase involved in cell wall biosynthesis
VSDAIYPYNKGGKEKRLYEMSTRLATMGHEVHIYCMKWWDGSKDRYEDGVHLHGICKLHNLYIGERRSMKEAIYFGIACLKIITQKFDVIDVDHMPYFPLFTVRLVCLIRRKKMIATWHEVWGAEYWKEYLGGFKASIAARIERLSTKLPHQVISISPHTTEQLIAKLSCKKEIITISNGLDIEAIQKVPAKRIENDFFYAGRLLKHKRIDLLIKAIAELKKNGKDVSCIVVGDGPEKSRLTKLAKKLELESSIAFHKFYEIHDDVYGLIKASKVFAFPTEREGFGIVAIEANACGKPVVTSLSPNNAASNLIVNGENGFHFKQDDVKSLAVSLDEALNQGSKLEKNCIASAKKFDWIPLSKRLAEVYAR